MRCREEGHIWVHGQQKAELERGAVSFLTAPLAQREAERCPYDHCMAMAPVRHPAHAAHQVAPAEKDPFLSLGGHFC